MKILDLGCGLLKNRSYKNNSKNTVIGLDRLALDGVDVVWDCEKTPLPFKDEEFDIINTENFLEHILNLSELLNECHRILKPNGILEIIVPHYSGISASASFEHVHTFSVRIFKINYCDYPVKYIPRWKILERRINYVPKRATNKFMKFLDKIVTPLININPVVYEKFFSGIIPADEIYFKLKKVK